jgi:hypothetical protein
MPRMKRYMSNALTKRLSAIFLWTEIMSVIKGSLHQASYLYQKYLNRPEYLRHGNPVLSKKEKSTIYYIFLKYEEWKLNVRAFDFLDVVNHVLTSTAGNRSHLGGGNGSLGDSKSTFDYLIIDEVQDL